MSAMVGPGKQLCSGRTLGHKHGYRCVYPIFFWGYCNLRRGAMLAQTVQLSMRRIRTTRNNESIDRLRWPEE